MDSVKHYNVIIIGAGPAGTGAAISLSKRGVKSVVILDRNIKRVGSLHGTGRKKEG